MKRIMVDLETLGLEDDAVILSIGWAVFDDKEVLSSAEVFLDIEDQREAGRAVDTGTLLWWITQAAENPAAAAWAQKGKGERVGQRGALAVLRNAFYHAEQNNGGSYDRSVVMDTNEIWANSPTFDLAKLTNLAGTTFWAPWKFYQERDFRTYREQAKKFGVAMPPHTGVKHSAEGDAVYQAQCVLAIEKQMALAVGTLKNAQAGIAP